MKKRHVSDDEIDLRVARAVKSRVEEVFAQRDVRDTMKIIRLQKRLEHEMETRISMEERLEQAEEDIAKILSQLMSRCGTCEEKLKEMKERLKYVEERLCENSCKVT